MGSLRKDQRLPAAPSGEGHALQEICGSQQDRQALLPYGSQIHGKWERGPPSDCHMTKGYDWQLVHRF